MNSIRVHHGSTIYLKQGFGSYHSRGAVMGGSAVAAAAEAMKARLTLRAGDLVGAAHAQSLAWRDGGVVDTDTGAMVATIAQLARDIPLHGSHESRGELSVEVGFRNDRLTYTFGVQLALVSVDPKTAQVQVEDFLCVEDVGRMLNPALVHGQTIGAAVQGLGGTFLDEFVYDEAGQLVSGSFADYLLPTSTDFPNVRAVTLEIARSPSNPLGVKGAGEGGIIGTGAAIANAVSNALAAEGVSVTRLPLSPDKLSQALREGRAASVEGA
jgi:aerobic carbon-monoxide dehydrogenase large subunit